MKNANEIEAIIEKYDCIITDDNTIIGSSEGKRRLFNDKILHRTKKTRRFNKWAQPKKGLNLVSDPYLQAVYTA